MKSQNRCEHCGAVRNAYEFRDGIPYRVKLVTVQYAGQALTLCEECNRTWVVEKRHSAEPTAKQLKMF